MIRPPSNISTYDEFYSKDPDIRQPKPRSFFDNAEVHPGMHIDSARDEMTRKDAIEVENLIRVARETGEWQPLITGPSPTKFVMRVIPGSLFRKLLDANYGSAEFSAMTLRIALTDIVLAGYKFKTCNHPTFGKIADESVIDVLDAIDMGIVNELSMAAIQRVHLRPKS